MIRISDAEYEVMKIIWEKDEITTMEIINRLKDHKWNTNTIRTLIKRLQIKGAIKVIRQEGSKYIYKAAIEAKKYKNEITKEMINKFYNGSLEDFVTDYCAHNTVTVEDVEVLLDYIDEESAKERRKRLEKIKEKKAKRQKK